MSIESDVALYTHHILLPFPPSLRIVHFWNLGTAPFLSARGKANSRLNCIRGTKLSVRFVLKRALNGSRARVGKRQTLKIERGRRNLQRRMWGTRPGRTDEEQTLSNIYRTNAPTNFQFLIQYSRSWLYRPRIQSNGSR